MKFIDILFYYEVYIFCNKAPDTSWLMLNFSHFVVVKIVIMSEKTENKPKRSKL